MTRRVVTFLLAVGILGCTCAWAQTDTGTSDINTPPAQPGPKPTFTYPDTTPSLDFLTGAIENSSITLGIGAGFAFDSNGYPSTVTTSHQSRWLFNVAPSIHIQQFFPKFSWHGSYAGGLQVYDQISGPANPNSSLFSQTAGGGFIWQFARRWQLLASESYRYSANPFDSYLTTIGTPTANNPNPVSYYPLTNFTQNDAVLTISNQLTKRDKLAFSGTENYRNTSNYNIVTSVPFYNLTSYGGRANYSHALSARTTLGVGYLYNSLDFGHGQQRSGIQTIEFTVDYLLRPNMTISGWVGPEYTSTKTVINLFGQNFVIHDSMWNVALGFNFGWQSRRNSFRMGYSRQVSDGGGITATSQVNNVSASYRREFTAKLSGLVGGRYLNSEGLATPGTQVQRSFNNYSFNLGLIYLIRKHFSVDANYIRLHQTQTNRFLLNPGTYNDNRVGVSVTYSWTHPLGR